MIRNEIIIGHHCSISFRIPILISFLLVASRININSTRPGGILSWLMLCFFDSSSLSKQMRISPVLVWGNIHWLTGLNSEKSPACYPSCLAQCFLISHRSHFSWVNQQHLAVTTKATDLLVDFSFGINGSKPSPICGWWRGYAPFRDTVQ